MQPIALAIGTDISCRNSFGEVATVLGHSIGRTGFCDSQLEPTEECTDLVRSFSMVKATPSEVGKGYCDYAGKTISFTHVGEGDYAITVAKPDGTLVERILKCVRVDPAC